MRANLFVYRNADDPWLREFRLAPVETLNAALPRLARITGAFTIPGEIKIRPADLYDQHRPSAPGVVLVGDAFAIHLPRYRHRHRQGLHRRRAALQRPHPAWLATEGMDEAKIAAFYDDPVKKACDAMVDRQGP